MPLNADGLHGAAGRGRNNAQNKDSASSSQAVANAMGGNFALQLQHRRPLQDYIETDDEIVIAKCRADKPPAGGSYYNELINKYMEPYQKASTPEQRGHILKAVADAIKCNADSEFSSGYVELGDKEISKKINIAFQRQVAKTKQILQSEKSQKPSLHHHQQHSGYFVPRLKSPVRKNKPREVASSKLKQLLENQRERQQQFSHQQPTAIPNIQMMQQQQSPQHDHLLQYQQRLTALSQNHGSFLRQTEKRESELIEAEMRRLRVHEQLQEPQPLRTNSQLFESLLKSSIGSEHNSPNDHPHRPEEKNSEHQQHLQNEMLTGTKTAALDSTKKDNSHASVRIQRKTKATAKKLKVVPARKSKPAIKKRPPPQGKSETIPLAFKKPPPESATPHSTQISQKTPHSAPKVVGASCAATTIAASASASAATASAATTKNEIGKAANALLELTLVPPPASQKSYPIGTRTKKYFMEFQGWFQGTIRSYNEATKLYSVEYEDSDVEELEHHEIDTGSLPPNKYDIGTQYEIYFWSKESGKKIGWFVGTVKSKYYHDPNHEKGPRNGRGTWWYNVVYSDGDSEDVNEAYITRSINKAKKQRGQRREENQAEHNDHQGCAAEQEQDSRSENSERDADDSSSDDDSESSEEEESSLDESSSEAEVGDPNIPYWTGKQHHQFILGLQKYGLGNLEEIHEADCIPDRSFQELVLYWHWYVSDLEEKGLVLNYEARGTVNGKKGRRNEEMNAEEKKEEKKEEPSVETNTKGFNTGKWTIQEQEMVAKASIYAGSSYKAMSDFMKTRSPKQVGSYFLSHKREIQKLSKKYAHDVPPIVPADKEEVKSKEEAKSKVWTPLEHAILVDALAIYGRVYKEVESYMKSRKTPQIVGYMKRNKKIMSEAEAKARLFKKQFPKKTHAWNCCELSRLVEGHAIFEKDFKRIADYVKTRTENQVRTILEANPSQYEDETAFDLGDHFSFPIELYHVLNVAPFEGFSNVVSWNNEGDCVLIHDNAQFSNIVFPRYSHRGVEVEKFYDNLERFGFQNQRIKKAKPNTGAFHHPAFQKEDYKKVEQFCRKAFG